MANSKSRGRIDIVNAGGEVVAQFVWLGTSQKGLGQWMNIADDSVSEKIAAALTAYADLSSADFVDLSAPAGYTRGWQGFEGYLQGLNLSLTPFGLSVQYETLVYPAN